MSYDADGLKVLKSLCRERGVNWRDFGTSRCDVVDAVMSIRPQITYQALTVPALKFICDVQDLPTSGTKNAPVRRLLESAKELKKAVAQRREWNWAVGLV